MIHDLYGDEIVAHLASRLGSYYPELPAYELSLTQSHSRSSYRWSTHLEFDVLLDGNATGHSILVKVPHATDPHGRRQSGTRLDTAEENSEREYKALKIIYQHLRDRELEWVTAVRPLDFIPEFHAIVMEKVPGRNLLEIANAAVTFRQESQAIQAAHRTGRLLKALHEIERGSSPHREGLSGEEYLARASSFLDTLQRLGLHQTYLSRLQDAVCILQAELDNSPEDVIHTFVHGDFYPENIVLTEQGAVYAVDTTLHRVAPAFEDVAKLLVGLGTMKRAMLLGRGLVNHNVLDQMKSAFLDGYFGNDPPHLRALTVYQILALLRRWCEIYAVARQFRPAWLSSVVRRVRIDPFMDARLSSLLAILLGLESQAYGLRSQTILPG